VNAVAALCPLINFNDWVKQVPWYIPLLPPVRKMLVGYADGVSRSTEHPANADSRIKGCVLSPAFYLQHGDKDWGVPSLQSVNFYNKLSESGLFKEGDLVLDILKGAPHAGAGPEYLEIKNVAPILNFFKRHMR